MLNPSWVWKLFFLIAALFIGGAVGFLIWGRHEAPSDVPPSEISSSTKNAQQRTPHTTTPSPYSSQQTEQLPLSTRPNKNISKPKKASLKKNSPT